MTQLSNDQPALVTLFGTVEKIIPALVPAIAEKAQIVVDGGEDLYREIRVDNTLLKLRPGTPVAITIQVAATQLPGN
jgi:hypothetical protein